MAAISSTTNTAYANTRMLWSNTATWQGGVVPGINDDVTIGGTKTTINQSAIGKWTGTITITVASTTGFPSSGFFITYTNYGEYVRVAYTGTTATTFTGCSIDYTDPLCVWRLSTAVTGNLSTTYRNYGSNIANGSGVYSPSPIISIPAGYYANVYTMIINNGGVLNVEPGGNLTANAYITLRDGQFLGSGNTGNIGTVTITRAEANGIGYLSNDSYTVSVMNLDGGETRSYATLNTTTSLGATSIAITPVQGSFAVGDEIAVYDTSYANSRNFMIGYRDWTSDTTAYQDEGFDVVGVSGNTLWLGRRNGARANVVSVSTSGSQKILKVDKNAHLSQVNFKANDTVVINNTQYTIDSVVDSEYTLASYNFQTGSTLGDFLTDYTTYANWSIDANGAYMNGSSWNVLVNKNIWRREIIVESEMSPWTGYANTSGTRGTDQFGIVFSYDPSLRSGNRNSNDSRQNGFWKAAKDMDSTVNLAHRGASPGDWMNTSLDTLSPGYKFITQAPATYRLENRNHITKVLVNGEQVGEKFATDGGMRGLAGIYVWANTNARVKSITYKAPTQDLYITTTDNFNVNDVVYESGIENPHWSGSRVLKIASKVTHPGTHDDLAFNYRGNPVYPAYDANTWPVPLTLNGSNQSSIYMLGDHDFSGGPDYYVSSTTANTAYIVDLSKQQTFTHVSFTPQMDHVGSAAGAALQGIQILGSNDNSTYTQLYGPVNDTKYFCNPQTDAYTWYNQMAYYYVGSQTYRYIKFIVNGHNGSLATTTNRLINFGVFNFASNNYTIQVNNVSDFANGDIITVMTHAPYTCNDDYHHYQAVKLGQDPATRFHTANTFSTIVNISGNTLYLDRPINYGYVEGGETVVKISRNFRIQGYYDTGNGTKFQKPSLLLNAGTAACQPKIFKNVWFHNVGSSRLGGSSWNRGVCFNMADYYNGCLLDGVSVVGYNNSDTNGLTFYYGWGVCRNGYVGNVRDYRPYYSNSRSGLSTFNMKFSNIYRFRPEDPQNRITNYNEVAGCYNIQTYVATNSNWYNNTDDGVLRRNNFHGIYNINQFSGGNQMIMDSSEFVFINEYNRIYACNNNAFNGMPLATASWPVGMDIHAEHPGMRLSQWRNEGFLNWYNVPSDISNAAAGNKDFGRASYDVCVPGDYNIAVKRSDWDYARVYSVTNDANLHLAAFTVWCKKAVPIQIYVEFQYRLPMRYQRLQGSSGSYGQLRLCVAQNGSFISGYNPLLIPLPTDDGWVKYSTTITTIPSAIGKTNVWISRNSMMTFADFRYGRAYVKTNYPDSVYTLINSFDFNKYFNLTNEKKHMMPLSSSPNIVKGVKF